MAKNMGKRKQRIAHNYASFDNESLPDDVLSKIFKGMDSNIIPNDTFESNLFKSCKIVPQKNERNSAETQASRNCANIMKKFGSNRKHPLMEKTKITLKQLKHNRQMPKPRAHLANLSFVDDPPVTKIPKRTNKVKEIKQSESKTKKISQELKKRNLPKKPIPSEKSSCPVEDSSEVERNNSNRIDDSSDSEYEKFIQKSKKGLKTKPKKANLKRKKSPPPKKVCKKTASNTKSVLTESDSELDDVVSPKPLYKNVRRTKKSQKISYNTRSRISEKDSGSDMDVFNGETYHASTSEDETFPDEPFICDDPFFLEMDIQNSSDKSDVTPLVDNGEFNCLRRTTGNTRTMGSDKINTLHKIPNVNSSGNQTDILANEQIDTRTIRSDKINTLHKIPNVNLSGNQTNISANEQIDTRTISDKINTLHKIPNVTSSGNQTNISANEQIDTPTMRSDKINTPHRIPNVTSSGNRTNISASEQIDTPTMRSDKINTLHRISNVTSSGNQINISANEQIGTPMRTDSINTLHKTSNVATLGNQTNISADKQIGTPMRTDPINTVHKIPNVISLGNQTNISANEQIDTIDLTDSDDESENPLPKIVKVSSQNENDSLSHSEDSEVEMVDVIVHPIEPKCNVVNIKNEKVDPMPSCSNTKQHNVGMNTKHEAVYATGMCREPEKDATKDNIKVPNLNSDNVQSILKDASILNKKVKEEPCDDDCEIILDSPSTNTSSKNFPDVPTYKNICIKTENNSKTSTTMDNDTLANKKVSNLSQKEQKLHAVACSNFKNLTESTNKKMEVLEDDTKKLSEIDIKSALKALKEEFATYNEIIQTEQYVESTFKLLEQRQAERLIALKSRITRLLGSTSSGSGECSINDAVNEFLSGAVLNSSQSSESCAKLSSEGSNVSSFHPETEDSKKSITLVPLSTIPEQDIKPNLSDLQSALNQTAGSSKSDETNNMSFGEKCIVCSKEAMAACEQCAKVFYCSNECGKKYWDAGHINTCQVLSNK